MNLSSISVFILIQRNMYALLSTDKVGMLVRDVHTHADRRIQAQRGSWTQGSISQLWKILRQYSCIVFPLEIWLQILGM